MWRCSLPGFPKDKWGENTAIWHMGHPDLLGDEEEYRDFDLGPCARPPETHLYGCPASWYRTPFTVSLLRYERRVTESGFSPSVFLDRCEDPLVVECIRFYERELLAARAHIDRIKFG